MPPSKRARAYARRRHDEWEERRRRRAAEQRRRAVVAAVVIGALVVATAAGAVVLLTRPAPSAADPDEPAAARSYATPPPAAQAGGRTWSGTIETSVGDLAVELDGAAAPQAVASFVVLAEDGFYDGVDCHRLVVGAILQCGDPTGTGLGGPGYTFGPIENAPADAAYPAGTLAMARQADDASSHGSQFFVTLHDVTIPPDEAGGYTVLGKIVDGLDALTDVEAGGTVGGGGEGQPAVAVRIEGVVVS